MLFRDRTQAGLRLAEALEHLRDAEAVILALPRGGVVVAAAVARALEAPLDVLVVRKLGAPMQPEFGFGAVSGDVCVLDDRTVRALGLSEDEINRVVAAERAELQRREAVYREGQPPLDVAGRTVVLIDDGLATGGTARAAVQALRHMHPARIVLAVPVAPPDTVAHLGRDVDELVCLAAPPDFQAVGRWYQYFDQISDEEVLDLLRQARQRHPSHA
ncbi:MAG: phosphoribosyltransferase [Planctomycetes bacterium]|nr:phosphoribosyltransferase [Planctomycetota bacterium]